jgi:hypothetical protein
LKSDVPDIAVIIRSKHTVLRFKPHLYRCFDAESGKLLWYSGGEKELKMNSKKADEKIAKAISKIMEEFPLEKIDGSLAINK